MSEQAEQTEHVEQEEGPTPEERLEWRMNALRLVRQFPDPAPRNHRAGPAVAVTFQVKPMCPPPRPDRHLCRLRPRWLSSDGHVDGGVADLDSHF